MTPKTYRILGICFCLLGAIIAVLNLQRTLNLGMKIVPIILFVLGARQFIRARKLEQQLQA